jgi:hypothetical protein
MTGSRNRIKPTLTDLPVELKRLVVHHADDSCLSDLRLVSKTFHAISTTPFGERKLASRRFVVSRYGLKGLVDLTASDLGMFFPFYMVF